MASVAVWSTLAGATAALEPLLTQEEPSAGIPISLECLLHLPNPLALGLWFGAAHTRPEHADGTPSRYPHPQSLRLHPNPLLGQRARHKIIAALVPHFNSSENSEIGKRRSKSAKSSGGRSHTEQGLAIQSGPESCAIDHEWLVKFIEHRIADKRVVRHVKKWLNAGVLEDGKCKRAKQGTPQGGSVSPLLANIYLHYAFDLWAHRWRKRNARGDVVIVRFDDDIVMGFQYRADAERFSTDLKERFCKFGLELHPDKTRLVEFGRYAAKNRRARGQGKPETFDFLGFTHLCGKTRKGWFFR